VGVHLGQRCARKDESSLGKPARLVVLSVATGFVAAIFLVWASAIYATQHFDLGVITFSLAICASAYGAGFLDRCVALNTGTYRVLAFSGYGAVSANYILGIVYAAGDPVFAAYCALGATAWTLATLQAALIVRLVVAVFSLSLGNRRLDKEVRPEALTDAFFFSCHVVTFGGRESGSCAASRFCVAPSVTLIHVVLRVRTHVDAPVPSFSLRPSSLRRSRVRHATV